MRNTIAVWIVLAMTTALAGCETLGRQFVAPDVTLASVRLGASDLSTQRFDLQFAVDNPNAVALPVRQVDYDVTLGGLSLASGSSAEPFRVPANGSGSFSVSVETSLVRVLQTLGTRILRGGETEFDYSAAGSVALDLPLVRPLPFSSTGKVSLAGR